MNATPIAAIGLGSNMGDPRANVKRAVSALSSAGQVLAVSRFYRTKPWGGPPGQADFCNAAVLLETLLEPLALLAELKRLESVLGRVPSERWGPRAIDLDILLYGRERIDHPDLCVPHARLFERAFALAPLADLDPLFASAFAGLDPQERESIALMSEDPLVDRVRTLAQAFLETDLMRLRIEEENEDAVELRRKAVAAPRRAPQDDEGSSGSPAPAAVADLVKADLVGIFHLSRPPVRDGDALEGDRELAYVEALGIRNPVRSLGAGRVRAVRCKDGDAVEYGQVLFEIDRV
ncbi:MAG: 2-amino-4-hydroxy-6-hydroxymethyldihydropteridine diphosphokinase [Candidatus Baltobacteraceae bacterium]